IGVQSNFLVHRFYSPVRFRDTHKHELAFCHTDVTQEDREKLVAKARAAKQAALVGLIPQEEADALWAEAEAACKPTEESLAKAKAAKDELAQAEKVLKAAQAAFAVGLIDEDAVATAKEKADAAKAIYTEAAKAAKGFSMGGGGGPRYKGQMSGLDAAFAILAESGIPMNAAAITKAAMERGLWTPDGATPASTLSGALQTDVKKGEKARFVKVSAGLYAVRQ
ncbi:MAG: winged helix-turn-helix domain-containing protein, partial [Planctomycetaceae bacterium]|nr:winged helix-turn-helix domain-containing protein [Planctomycetaceae bacterium]